MTLCLCKVDASRKREGEEEEEVATRDNLITDTLRVYHNALGDNNQRPRKAETSLGNEVFCLCEERERVSIESSLSVDNGRLLYRR